MTTNDALDRGREAFGRHAWGDAHARLSAADRLATLDGAYLDRLATAAAPYRSGCRKRRHLHTGAS